MSRPMTSDDARAMVHARWPEKYPLENALRHLRQQRDESIGRTAELNAAIQSIERLSADARAASVTRPSADTSMSRIPNVRSAPTKRKYRAHIPAICQWEGCPRVGRKYLAKKSNQMYCGGYCRDQAEKHRYSGTCERSECRKPWSSNIPRRFCSPTCAIIALGNHGRRASKTAKATVRGTTLFPGDATKA